MAVKVKEARQAATSEVRQSAAATPLNPDQDDCFITSETLAQRLRVCVATLSNWRKAGKLPYVQVERRVLWHWPSVQQALLRMQRNGGAV